MQSRHTFVGYIERALIEADSIRLYLVVVAEALEVVGAGRTGTYISSLFIHSLRRGGVADGCGTSTHTLGTH